MDCLHLYPLLPMYKDPQEYGNYLLPFVHTYQEDGKLLVRYTHYKYKIFIDEYNYLKYQRVYPNEPL